MKKILCLIIVFTFISCNKNKVHEGNTTAFKNGEEWNVSNVIRPKRPLSDYFKVSSRTFDSFGAIEEDLDIFKIPYDTGKYYLHQTNGVTDDSLVGANLLVFLEGDQLIGGWGIPEEPDSSNYVHITFYDECTREVEGTFNCTLVGNTIDGTGPDTIRFTDGRFEGKISQE